ncbi:hypothetical protein BDZ89DRAFT_1140935 [Hymenopellis radicata]|nr:hypothetical protein BDZ89DRAFT_1140935 [Hymenopellis radicata]
MSIEYIDISSDSEIEEIPAPRTEGPGRRLGTRPIAASATHRSRVQADEATDNGMGDDHDATENQQLRTEIAQLREQLSTMENAYLRALHHDQTTTQDILIRDKLLKEKLSLQQTIEDVMRCQEKAFADLEHTMICPLCLHVSSAPFLIVPCGHTFCKTCIEGWFSLALHRYNHSIFNPDFNMVGFNRADLRSDVVSLLTSDELDVRSLSALIEARGSHVPEYTCPSCKVKVTRAPVLCRQYGNAVEEVMMKQERLTGVTGHRRLTDEDMERRCNWHQYFMFFP